MWVRIAVCACVVALMGGCADEASGGGGSEKPADAGDAGLADVVGDAGDVGADAGPADSGAAPDQAADAGAPDTAAPDTGWDVWAPTTHPYDPACEGCQQVGVVAMGHLGGAVTLRFDPLVDDPVAQWGDCVESLLVCLEGGGDPLSCGDSADCPAACKAAFQAQVTGISDVEGQVGALEAVYIVPGAPCRPQEVTP